MELKNSLMLITGASSGIGEATALAAAKNGARLALVARDTARLDALVARIRRDGGQAQAFPADLADLPATAAVCARVRAEAGLPEVVFNNAGAGRWLFAEETSPAEAEAMMAVPYTAAFAVTRAFLPEMLTRRQGVVVNMTSIAGHMVWPGAAAYSAARWAVRGYTEALRADFHGTGLRAMLVTFAKVASDYWHNNPGSELRVPGAQASIPQLSPAQAAEAILDGLRRDKDEVVEPRELRTLLFFNRLFPRQIQQYVWPTAARRAAATAQ